MKPNYRIAVIIPFRNERGNLQFWTHFLHSFSNPEICFLFVNDHSDDEGELLLSTTLNDDIRLLSLGSDEYGKKKAIAAGITHSQSEFILTLDADVRVEESYFSHLLSHINSSLNFAILPVELECNSTLVGKYQYAEWQMLQAMTSASFQLSVPMLCNGANLLFSRLFYEGCRHSNMGISSGDDMFLLIEAVTRNVEVNLFWKKQLAVKTNALHSFKSALNQRLRWAGKSTKYPRSKMDVMYGGFVLWQLTKLGLLVCSFQITFLILPWLFCGLFETFAVIAFQREFYKRSHLFTQFIVALVYPFISLFIFITSWFIKPSWKGRVVSLS